MPVRGFSRVRTSTIGLAAAALGALALFASPASALTKVSATAVPGPSGIYKAKMQCPSGQRAISGGFRSNQGDNFPVSRAIRPDTWLVKGFDPNFTGYAYCSKTMRIAHATKSVDGNDEPTNTDSGASCPSGTTLVSGGYRMSDPSSRGNAPIYSSFPASGKKWSIVGLLDSPGTLKSFAYCAKDAVDVRMRTSKATSPGGDEDVTVTAKCHSGEELLSGGFHTTPEPDWDNSAGPDTFFSDSYSSTAGAWTVSAIDYSSFVGGHVTAYAVCAS